MKARFGAAVVVAALLGAGLSGCAFVTPQATVLEVETSNGVSGNVGSIDIRNATLITDNDGETASLLVSVYNSDISTKKLVLQFESASGEKVELESFATGGALTSFGAKGEDVLLFEGIDAPAGSLFPIFFQSGSDEGVELRVPVLTSEWEEYKGLAPQE